MFGPVHRENAAISTSGDSQQFIIVERVNREQVLDLEGRMSISNQQPSHGLHEVADDAESDEHDQPKDKSTHQPRMLSVQLAHLLLID